MRLHVQHTMALNKIYFFFSIIGIFSTSCYTYAQNYDRDSFNYLLESPNNPNAKLYHNSFQNDLADDNSLATAEWLIDKSRLAMVDQNKDDAFLYLQESLKILDKLGNQELAYEAKVNLIEWYRANRFYENAIPIINELNQQPPLSAKLHARFYHRVSATYNELGVVSENEHYLDSAILYSEMSLGLSVVHGFVDYQITSFTELGSIYKVLFKYDQAIENLKKSIGICSGYNSEMYANALRNLGATYIEMNEPDSAIKYLKLAIKAPIQSNNYILKTDIYRSFKRVYLESGDSLNYLKTALLQEKFRALAIEQQLNDKVHEISNSYELQRRDDEISKNNILINQQKKERWYVVAVSLILTLLLIVTLVSYGVMRKRNTKLEALMYENDFLMQEANHRIKNNLQLIISLIGREINKSESNQLQLNSLSNRINAISSLHQHLYLKEEKEYVGLQAYVDHIVQNLKSTLAEDFVDISCEIEDFDIHMDKATYVGLLITELLTNSFKHAFSSAEGQQNNIWLTINLDHKKICISYQDNGKGINENERPSLIGLLQKQLGASKLEENSATGYGYKIWFEA